MKSSSYTLLPAVWVAKAVVCLASDAIPTVDLGYARYQGYYNDTYELNVFKG